MSERITVSRSESLEVNMYPTAYLELPMSKPPAPSDEKPSNPFNIQLSLSEKFITEDRFDYLEIQVSVGADDPRLRAIDVYTQYGGMRSLVIKHFPSFWPNGIIHKQLYPEWSNEPDRVLDEDETVITNFEEDIDYNGASGMFAHSRRKSLSYNSGSHSSLELGMLRGYEPDVNWDAVGENEIEYINRILVKLSERKELTIGEEATQYVAIADGHNPLYETSWKFRDHHPIPFSIYIIDYYYLNKNGRVESGSTEGQLYNPDHLKAGTITSIERVSSAPNGSNGYNYTVKVIDGSSPGIGWSWHDEYVTNCWYKFEVGDWVLLAKIGSLASGISETERTGVKKEEIGWTIVPTTKLYWEQVVDFLRRQLI